MISLEQVRQLDIRVKKAVAAVKTLSAENAALKQRIGELQNEEAARAADEQQLEVSLQGVLDVLDEVDEETSELIADDPMVMGMGMDEEDDFPGQPDDASAEDAQAGPSAEAGAEAADETENGDADEAAGAGSDETDGADGGAASGSAEGSGAAGEAASGGAEGSGAAGEAAGGGAEGSGAAEGEAPKGLGEAVSPDPGIEALKGGGAEDETEAADQEITPKSDPENENPVQTEFDIF